jgi:hypothetical protein
MSFVVIANTTSNGIMYFLIAFNFNLIHKTKPYSSLHFNLLLQKKKKDPLGVWDLLVCETRDTKVYISYFLLDLNLWLLEKKHIFLTIKPTQIILYHIEKSYYNINLKNLNWKFQKIQQLYHLMCNLSLSSFKFVQLKNYIIIFYSIHNLIYWCVLCFHLHLTIINH